MRQFHVCFHAVVTHPDPATLDEEVSDLKLQLCADCLNDAAAPALAAIEDALEHANLKPRVTATLSPCLKVCDSPTVLALQMNGAASYVFADIDPVVDAADIAATCQAYLEHPGGWIEDARPCGRLRHCLTVRVPA